MMDMFAAMSFGFLLGICAGGVMMWEQLAAKDYEIDVISNQKHESDKRAENLAEECRSLQHQVEHLQGCHALAIRTLNAPQDAT